MAASTEEQGALQSVSRGLQVLEYLCLAAEDCGVIEISKALKVNKATIFRILNTLSIMGFAEQNPKTQKYRATMKILSLSNKILNRLEIRTIAMPFLNSLAKETGLSTHLAILGKDEIIIVEKVTTDSGLRFHIGRRSPLYCTGIGKVFLSHMPEADFETYLERDFIAYTPNTIANAADLRGEISKVARDGYAVDYQEHNLGISCVAAPVKDFTNKVIAALSVTGSSVQVESNTQNLAEAVLDVARQLSEKLGFFS